MPHPKNLMKLSGDVHPPEVEYDLGADLDDAAAVEATAGPGELDMASGEGMQAEPQAPRTELGPSERYFEEARAEVRRRPYGTILAAFALGFLLMKLFR